MKKEFLIEDGVLIKYEGSSRDIVIPDEVTIINPKAISSARKIVLNANCKKICEGAIYDRSHSFEELVIPQDSKLSIIEKNAIYGNMSTKPVVLPDNIKVFNEGLPPVANLPRKLQTIKRFAFSLFHETTKGIIYYMPETLKKIENGCSGKNIFITRNNKPLEGWNIPSYEIDNVVFSVIDETIYEEGGFKYVICQDEDGVYAAIVSIPLRPFVIIPETIGNYIVKVVSFIPDEIGINKIMPTLYISKHVFQISFLYQNPIILGEEFSKKLSSKRDFINLKQSGNVFSGIKRSDIKHDKDFYYVSNPNGVTLLCYDGEETKRIYIPDEINGMPVTEIATEAFQFLQGKVDFIKYPEACEFPSWAKVMRDNRKTIMVNSHGVFNDPIINHYNKSATILGYEEKDGFKMLHIKDVDEEGYVIVDLDYSVKEKMVMNPPTRVNNLKVLGISYELLNKRYMNSEMAKRYYSIYKKIY